MTSRDDVQRQLTTVMTGGVSSFIVAIVLGLLAWTAVSLLSGGFVPSVLDVSIEVYELLGDVSTYGHIWLTLRRILMVYLVTLPLGVLVGTAMGLSRKAQAFFRPLVAIGLAIPDVVYFILAALILGIEERAALVAMGIAVIPYIINVVVSGAQARDTRLDEMSHVYRLRFRQYLSMVVGMQLIPSLLAAARTGFAFSWKLVVLMEALTQPDGIGARIYLSFRLLRPDEMIGYALIFTVIILGISWLVFTPAERRLMAWRAPVSTDRLKASSAMVS